MKRREVNTHHWTAKKHEASLEKSPGRVVRLRHDRPFGDDVDVTGDCRNDESRSPIGDDDFNALSRAQRARGPRRSAYSGPRPTPGSPTPKQGDPPLGATRTAMVETGIGLM